MTDNTPDARPAGWYHAQGDPPGTQRYWNGEEWEGDPHPVPGASPDASPEDVWAPTDPINRVGARVLDIVVWALLLIPVGLVVAGGAMLEADPEVSYAAQAVSNTVGVALVAAYETFFVGTWGATLGKMAVGALTARPLRVVRTDGSAASYTDGAFRIAPFVVLQGLAGFLGPIGQVLTIGTWAVAVISVVLLFTNDLRQAVWDKMADTTVVSP
jgi:uncharacterized RDD family membrane protein YckC